MIYELKEKKETLDQVTCLKCLTKIFEFKKKKCRLCMERIDRDVW